MPLFNETPEDKLKRESAELKQLAESKAIDIVLTFQRFAEFVWNHPTYTPQQVLDIFGANAGRLFLLSNALQPLITLTTGQEANPVPRNYVFVINEDGTVTVTHNPDHLTNIP